MTLIDFSTLACEQYDPTPFSKIVQRSVWKRDADKRPAESTTTPQPPRPPSTTTSNNEKDKDDGATKVENATASTAVVPYRGAYFNDDSLFLPHPAPDPSVVAERVAALDRRERRAAERRRAERTRSEHRRGDDLVRELVARTPVYGRLVSDPSAATVGESVLPGLRLSERRRAELEARRRERERELCSTSTTGDGGGLVGGLRGLDLVDWTAGVNWKGCDVVKNDGDKHKDDEDDDDDLLAQTFNLELESMNLLSSGVINWEGVPRDGGGRRRRPVVSCPLLLHESVAGASVARSAVPRRRPEPFSRSDAFAARYVAASGDGADGGGGSWLDRDAEDRDFEIKQKRRAQLEAEKKNRVEFALDTLELGGGKGRTITSSLMGPGGTQRTGRPSRHDARGAAHDAARVPQPDPLVTDHVLVKADHTPSELRRRCRPRLTRTVVRENLTWRFRIKVASPDDGVGGRAAAMRRQVGGAGVLRSYRHHSSAENHVPRTANDLSADEGALLVLEYCEESPPLQMSKGMACRVVNYYRGDKSRCPISAGGGDRPTRKRGETDPSNNDKEKTDPHSHHHHTTGGRAGAGRPPPLLGPEVAEDMDWGSLVGVDHLRADVTAGGDDKEKRKKRDAEKEKQALDMLPEGATEVLHPKRGHGPFIGEVEVGTTQSGLISNLFAAPIFRHTPESTDFLMILGKKPSKQSRHGGAPAHLSVVLRPFPANIYTVGQTEPRVKVNAPNATAEKEFLKHFVTFQIAKHLELQQRKDGRGLKLDDIKEWIFPNTPQSTNNIRPRLKMVANHDTKTQMWTTKRYNEDGYRGVGPLGRCFSPEDAVAYESARASVRRLEDLGIRHVDSSPNTVANVGAAMIYLHAGATAARERKTNMTKMRDSARRDKGTPARLLTLYDRVVEKLEGNAKRQKQVQALARFVYEALQLTPWHLTSEFIDVHKRKQGTAMMKLTGLGDPSGKGEAYNFLREMDAKPNKETGNSDGALNAQIKKITGTENDLRRLTMKQMAQLLKSYGLEDKAIAKLKRWDRVHVIRDVSTRSEGHDGLDPRFARGEKMKLSDQKKMYTERIQEIWRRQIKALSTDAGVLYSTAAKSADADREAAEADDDDDGSDFDLDDLDDDDEEDFYKSLASEIVDERRVRQIEAENAMKGGQDGHHRPKRSANDPDNSDSMALMQWQREREEERRAQERLRDVETDSAAHGTDNSVATGDNGRNEARMVIRRKITKTLANGRQTTTFKFIVLPKEVEKVKKEKKKEEAAKIKGHGKKDRRSRGQQQHGRSERRKSALNDFGTGEPNVVGHAMFEEDDDLRGGSRKPKIKLEVRHKTITIKNKPSSPNTDPSYSPRNSSGGGKSGGKRSSSSNKDGSSSRKTKEKRKRRRREAEEADVYSLSSQRKGTSNRRERGAARERMPHVILADRLESIRSEVENRQMSNPFHRPVSRKQMPQYYEIIKDPIDLQTIRDKNARYEYRTCDLFVEDFLLMQNNAVRFNGKDTIIGEEATKIYQFVKETVDKRREEFRELENAVQDRLNGGTSSKRSKKSGGDKSSTSTDSVDAAPNKSVTTASAVLDGVDQTVNLGDNISLDFGDDTDSD